MSTRVSTDRPNTTTRAARVKRGRWLWVAVVTVAAVLASFLATRSANTPVTRVADNVATRWVDRALAPCVPAIPPSIPGHRGRPALTR